MQTLIQLMRQPNAHAPRDIHSILAQLKQTVARARRWPACSHRDCRRARRCASPALDCATVALSPAQQAATLAQLRRVLGQG